MHILLTIDLSRISELYPVNYVIIFHLTCSILSCKQTTTTITNIIVYCNITAILNYDMVQIFVLSIIVKQISKKFGADHTGLGQSIEHFHHNPNNCCGDNIPWIDINTYFIEISRSLHMWADATDCLTSEDNLISK